ncbi:MAG: DUF4438 domain-containing protein [Thermotogota bacterium]
MLKTNKDKLVMQSVQGKIHHPGGKNYRVHNEGEPMILPATGGITYNFRVGDTAFDLVGDHVEPGVSIRNEERIENDALMSLSCIGNKAIVVSGEAKGCEGFVTGSHGGIEHTIIDFDKEEMFKMAIDDKILVRAYGQGLKLEDYYPEIKVMNVDPDLFENIPIEEKEDKLIVPVTCKIPAHLMGSGVGSASAYNGDYDIMTSDVDEIERLGIDKLKFGDLVLIENHDNSYGRTYFKGAVSIGIVVHSNCIKAGHGPGITTIITSRKPLIEGKIDLESNIKKYFNV